MSSLAASHSLRTGSALPLSPLMLKLETLIGGARWAAGCGLLWLLGIHRGGVFSGWSARGSRLGIRGGFLSFHRGVALRWNLDQYVLNLLGLTVVPFADCLRRVLLEDGINTAESESQVRSFPFFGEAIHRVIRIMGHGNSSSLEWWHPVLLHYPDQPGTMLYVAEYLQSALSDEAQIEQGSWG